eukprot:scaffold119135_cov20-Tisochrysis_lutea.AAC.1
MHSNGSSAHANDSADFCARALRWKPVLFNLLLRWTPQTHSHTCAGSVTCTQALSSLLLRVDTHTHTCTWECHVHAGGSIARADRPVAGSINEDNSDSDSGGAWGKSRKMRRTQGLSESDDASEQGQEQRGNREEGVLKGAKAGGRDSNRGTAKASKGGVLQGPKQDHGKGGEGGKSRSSDSGEEGREMQRTIDDPKVHNSRAEGLAKGGGPMGSSEDEDEWGRGMMRRSGGRRAKVWEESEPQGLLQPEELQTSVGMEANQASRKAGRGHSVHHSKGTQEGPQGQPQGQQQGLEMQTVESGDGEGGWASIGRRLKRRVVVGDSDSEGGTGGEVHRQQGLQQQRQQLSSAQGTPAPKAGPRAGADPSYMEKGDEVIASSSSGGSSSESEEEDEEEPEHVKNARGVGVSGMT